MTEQKSCWDQVAALESVDGDKELLAEMAELFLQDSSRLVDEIEQAIERGDSSAVHHSAHTLKGSVANFAAERARALSLQLELMGRAGNLSGARERFAQLAAEIRLVETELSDFTGATI